MTTRTAPPPADTGSTSPATPVAHDPPRRRLSARGRRDLGAAALFLAPVVACMVLFRFLSAASALVDSFRQKLPGSLNPPRFVGLDNYTDLLTSPAFWGSVVQTLVFNVVVNPLQVVLALALAVLLSHRVHSSGLWRTLIFLPAAIPMLGSTIVWGILLRPDGLVNGIVRALGGQPVPWLTSPTVVLWSMVLIASWIGIGYWMIILIAGLNEIPTSLYEAADLDGAGAVRRFRSITLPLMRRSLLFVLVADTVANFVLFAPVQVLTRGGPEGASNLLMYDIYHVTFDLFDPYRGAAELVLLLVIMLLIVAVQFRLLGGEHE